jgi:type II secretory pathway component GspD/PulD (secretin)
MRTIVYAGVGLFLLAFFDSTYVQAAAATTSEVSQEGTMPISRLLSLVAKKTGKKLVVDPRVRGDVMLIGQDPSNISYGDFLTILQMYGFAAVESGGYVLVVPDVTIRAMPVPLLSGKESHPDAEYVSKVISVKNMPAAFLVPVLRPLLPQHAHLAAITCSNVLVVVDTFANVRRLEAMIQSVDIGETYKPEKCDAKESSPRDSSLKREN